MLKTVPLLLFGITAGSSMEFVGEGIGLRPRLNYRSILIDYILSRW